MAGLDFEPQTGADWLRLAVGTLAQTAPQDVLCGAASPWGAQPLPRRGSARQRHPIGLHKHPFLELCLGLRGEPVMDMGEKRYAFAPPRLALIEAGVVHAEGFLRKNKAYAVVWLRFQRASLLSHVSIYQPATGWGGMPPVMHRSPAVARFHEMLRRPLPETPDEFEQMRALLLEILSETYRAEVDRRTMRQTTGAQQVQHAVVQWVREYLDAHFAQQVEVALLAELTGYTPNYLNNLFRDAMGEPIHRYLTRRRMTVARDLCRADALSVQEIARAVGYDDPLYFSRAFRNFHGASPTAVRGAVN